MSSSANKYFCLGDEQCLLYVGPFHVANWVGVEADKLLGTGPIFLQIFLLILELFRSAVVSAGLGAGISYNCW